MTARTTTTKPAATKPAAQDGAAILAGLLAKSKPDPIATLVDAILAASGASQAEAAAMRPALMALPIAQLQAAVKASQAEAPTPRVPTHTLADVLPLVATIAATAKPHRWTSGSTGWLANWRTESVDGVKYTVKVEIILTGSKPVPVQS